ncbi:MAG: bifunctional fucokinase/L-fucose-1-P-guanylyltransferase [Lachnospiraceae bacterium]|nr:bifunctional fucokinase/L-fucose-1-P-guanylyltransferase [Lachnospiraceae bacterium]
MNNEMIPLFHAQVYKDAWDDYQRALHRVNFSRWDYIILTASNEQQAEGFRAQLELRRSLDFLPMGTHFAVIPDRDGKRVGSGGATLGVIRYVEEQERLKGAENVDFSGIRILVIHSGGDSKRVPQYSALGKLFSPVPRTLPNGRPSTLFDEFMISMAGVPGRIREGMLLLSGDVLLLFNPLLIDYTGEGAAAISFKENVETGKNHGVYLNGENGCVARCLQKQSVEVLRRAGAVNEYDNVDIDTGAVIFSSQMLKNLFGLISKNGAYDDDRYEQFVNDKVRLSLYADFLYPLGSEATLEDFYKEKPEGEFSEELTVCRKAVWEALRPFRMKLLRLAPAKFIHFGTTREIMKLMNEEIESYSQLGWSDSVNSSIDRSGVAGYNSVLEDDAVCGDNVYLESSYVAENSAIGSHCVISFVDVQGLNIPDGVVLHGLKQKDGRFVVRIYGVDDNPKGDMFNSFLGSSLEKFMKTYGISENELWDDDNKTVWTAKLYPVAPSIYRAAEEAVNVYKLMQGSGDIEAWRKAERKSLCSGFNEADPQAIIDWDRHMSDVVAMDGIVKAIGDKTPISELVENKEFAGGAPSAPQMEWLGKYMANADYSERMRMYYYIGRLSDGMFAENYMGKSFETIGRGILEASLEGVAQNTTARFAMDEHVVRLPLRVNWGGGWSDTPPYCNENGGTVLNAAIKLNGEYPVEVKLKRLPENKVEFISNDMGVHGVFEDIEELQSVGDPFDPYVLQKAALLACGILPLKGGNLQKILTRLGGGISLQTEVTGVPKGSGLGTSSILAAACAKAIMEFCAVDICEEELSNVVLRMEQIMSTGGGWQDQVGGLSLGIKYIRTMPGLEQNIHVEHVNMPQEAYSELRDRFALIYTGQRRLARNLLRDVVGRYIGNEPDTVFALNEIQRVASLMKFELERGHVDDFASLLNDHWELSKKIDGGSTNTLIDQIFESIADLIDGRMICGAGGGGFLQVVMKRGVTTGDLHKRLTDIFQDSTIDVWNCTLV